MRTAITSVRVGIEVTPKKAFASALDWPGWSRSGRHENAALDALSAYRERYLPVADVAGAGVPPPGPYVVAETRPGDATTAFGAPSITFAADVEPVDDLAGERLAALLAASWSAFDRIVAGAPLELRKGPRGGGRDRDRIVQHVADAHGGYLRPMGLRLPGTTDQASIRSAMLEVLRTPSVGMPPLGAKWPQRYAARRVAWHALDHAWEIEDRTQP